MGVIWRTDRTTYDRKSVLMTLHIWGTGIRRQELKNKHRVLTTTILSSNFNLWLFCPTKLLETEWKKPYIIPSGKLCPLQVHSSVSRLGVDPSPFPHFLSQASMCITYRYNCMCDTPFSAPSAHLNTYTHLSGAGWNVTYPSRFSSSNSSFVIFTAEASPLPLYTNTKETS